jgi:hypothetical protein
MQKALMIKKTDINVSDSLIERSKQHVLQGSRQSAWFDRIFTQPWQFWNASPFAHCVSSAASAACLARIAITASPMSVWK